MRVLGYVIMGILAGMGVMSLLQERGQISSMVSPVSYAMPVTESDQASNAKDPMPWTGKDLLEMAQIYDSQADELQSEAVKLEQRAINLAQQPYMDPKGFTRTGFMHVAAARWKAAKELRELAVMHRSEGQRLLALEKAGGKNQG
jgi:hypothetical protein